MKKEEKKEFLEHRTSWKWFERKSQNLKWPDNTTKEELDFRIRLEILKELQHLNNK